MGTSFHRRFTIPLLLGAAAVVACIAASHAAPAADASAARDSAHRRMAFMCEWVDGRFESSWRLRPCSAQEIAQASDVQLSAAMEAFYRDYAGAADTHITRAEFELAYLHKYPNASRKALDIEMGALSVERLCSSVRYKNGIADIAVGELARRKVLADSDLRFVTKYTVGIGMSQAALLCLMGAPDQRNRTVTAKGEDIQWVYGKTRVYTANGIVTAFQD